MHPYRVAIIGTGAIAPAHINALRAAGERVELVAAVGIDAEHTGAFCSQHNIPGQFTIVDEMLAQAKPDLVHILTPPGLHADFCIRCLEAGAWVFCEKPLCASLAEFDRIAEAEARTGHYVNTVFQWRFGSTGQHVKRLIEQDAFGRFLVGTCLTLWYRTAEYYAVDWRGKWVTEIGGVTMGHGIHLMDLFLWLQPDWAEIQAVAETLDRDIEVDTVSMALVKFQSGALASIANSVVSPRQQTHLRLDFQRATVEVSGLYGYANENWRFSIPDGSPDADALAAWQTIPTDVPSSQSAQLAAMLDSMDRNERPAVSGDESRRILEFAASLYKSALTRQPVRRGTITPDDPFYHAMNGQP